MADPRLLRSELLGADPEADVLLSELRSSGPEGRPATPTTPTRQDLGFSDVMGRVSRKLGRAANIMEGKQPDQLKQMEQVLTVAKAFQDFGADPKKASAWLAESAKEAGLDLPPEVFSEAFTSPFGVEALAKTFPDILAMPPSSRRKLLSDPTFLRGLLEEPRKKAEQEKKTGEERRKFALEQGYTAEQSEEYATTGKLPGGGTPKARQAEAASKALIEAREASTAASKQLAAIRSGQKPPTFNELTLMIQRLAKTREALEFSVGIPEEERLALVDDINKGIAAVGAMMSEIAERRGGKPGEKPAAPTPKPQAETKAPEGLPPAAQNKGKTFKDTETGKRWKSDGAKWTEVK